MGQSPEERQFISNEIINSRSIEINAAVDEVAAVSLGGTPQPSSAPSAQPHPNPNTMAYQDQTTKEVENFLDRARKEVNKAFSTEDLADAA